MSVAFLFSLACNISIYPAYNNVEPINRNMSKKINISSEQDMIEVAETFLHQETSFSQSDVINMDEFEKYYQARSIVKAWNTLDEEERKAKELALEISGIEFKND